MSLRLCDECGWKMEPGTPRRSSQGRLLCPSCDSKTISAKASGGPMDQVRKVAHDSGDGETIYHCPFCGSGQVIARSDRTIECQFCHVCFTVQVQPQFPAFPQTIDGQPVQVPGMPGQIAPAGPPGMDPGMDPAAGDPNAPVDPSQVGADGQVPPGADQGDEDQGGDDEDDDSGGDAPPWAKKSLRTSSGHLVPAEDYKHHLALHFAPDKQAMTTKIKESRR